ncbi:MAG: hypothetical protein EOO20_00995 [Chryseobacterium sp.]|nr:MAG: hypothetical protein EOO20_00995 [Chryseobacterium sp.]
MWTIPKTKIKTMEKLSQVLEKKIPELFLVTQESDHISVRDRERPKGEGFLLSIFDEPRFLRATVKFEDYAMPLVSYAERQLLNNTDVAKEILARHPNLVLRRQRLLAEDLFTSSEQKELTWWLEIELKKQHSREEDMLVFSDLLIYWIFFLFPYQVHGQQEGQDSLKISRHYERSSANRSLCLAFHGYQCKACGINMKKQYNTLAEDFIQVHHIIPVSESGTRTFDPIKDLVPLCPNCHSVAHLKNPPYTVAEIKSMLSDDGLFTK